MGKCISLFRLHGLDDMRHKNLDDCTFMELRDMLWDFRYDLDCPDAWEIYTRMRKLDGKRARRVYDSFRFIAERELVDRWLNGTDSEEWF